MTKIFDVQDAYYFCDIKHEETDSMRGSSDYKVTCYGMLNVAREQIKNITAMKVVNVFFCMFISNLYTNRTQPVKEKGEGTA
jgi:hypothetical protein